MTLNNSIPFGVLQQDQTDCGVACVLTILKYFDIIEEHEKVRNLTGKTFTGVTLLGMSEALRHFTIDCDGYEGSIEHLKRLAIHAFCTQYQRRSFSILLC